MALEEIIAVDPLGHTIWKNTYLEKALEFCSEEEVRVEREQKEIKEMFNRERELENLNKMMEERAGDKQEYGKRQPGEKGMYERIRIQPIELEARSYRGDRPESES